MFETDTHHIVPTGEAHIHVQGDTIQRNVEITRLRAALLTLQGNNPDVLRNQFNFAREPTAYYATLQNGDRVGTMKPTGEYAPGALMVTALPADIVEARYAEVSRDPDGRVTTRNIFNFTFLTQVEYFKQIIAGIDASTSFLQDHPNLASQIGQSAVCAENCAFTVSNGQYRSARTISLPHAQIFPRSLAQDSETNTPPRTALEQALLKSTMDLVTDNALDEIYKFLSPVSPDIQLKRRTVPPFGYTLVTPLTSEMPQQRKGAYVAKLLQSNLTIYSVVAHRMEQQLAHKYAKGRGSTLLAHRLPQPSYKAYYFYDTNGKFCITITPTLFAPSGVMESANRPISRSPQYPDEFGTPENRTAYLTGVRDKMKELLQK